MYSNISFIFIQNSTDGLPPKLFNLQLHRKWPGSVHDSRVFRDSAFRDKFESGIITYVGCVLCTINSEVI